jgi:hypothetical protein
MKQIIFFLNPPFFISMAAAAKLIGWKNFAAVAMETKKGDLKNIWIPFIKLHETL